MTDENEAVEPQEPEAPAVEEEPVAEQPVDLCDRCDCPDCPGVNPDTTAELAQHSKACPEKHY